jgi:hypothetical protein
VAESLTASVLEFFSPCKPFTFGNWKNRKSSGKMAMSLIGYRATSEPLGVTKTIVDLKHDGMITVERLLDNSERQGMRQCWPPHLSLKSDGGAIPAADLPKTRRWIWSTHIYAGT